jgi:hypothetical protein
VYICFRDIFFYYRVSEYLFRLPDIQNISVASYCIPLAFTPSFSEVRCAAQFLVFYVVFCRPPIIYFFCHFSIGYCIVYASSNFPSIDQIDVFNSYCQSCVEVYSIQTCHRPLSVTWGMRGVLDTNLS